MAGHNSPRSGHSVRIGDGEQVAERPYLGIDHVVIRTATAEPLYNLLHKQLGLPVTWPLQSAPFATYGWIGVGNTNLEIWAAVDNSDLPTDCPLPLFQQIAIAPTSLEETVASIQASGLTCKAQASNPTHGKSMAPVHERRPGTRIVPLFI
jgi:hypothetical protein